MALHRQPKLVLQPGRSKLGALLFLMAFCTVCGVGLALDGYMAGWAIVATGAIMCLAGWRFLRSSRFDLRLNQSGLAFGTILGRHAFSWCDVQSIAVVGFGANRLVALSIVPEVNGGTLALLSRRVCGFDRVLTETYGLPADELARLLESWRARYGKRHINPAIVAPEKVAVCV